MGLRSSWIGKIFAIFVLGILFTFAVAAEPTGPSSINNLGSSRYDLGDTGTAFPALAGNVTEINLTATMITNTWQGYFGNITGTIVLGNANNQSMYSWNAASPQGEVYATRSVTTPVWASVACANYTQITTEDGTLGVNQSVDGDSVNRTFLNTTSFNPFYAGAVTIDGGAQNCYAANLYDESGASSSDFQEVLLTDGTAMVYTALISQDALGFDNRNHDFQMLVGENGHNGDVNPTTYYFYVELG